MFLISTKNPLLGVPIATGIGVKNKIRVELQKRSKKKRRKGGCENQERVLLMR
jgi:hypothetical protein